MSGLTSSSGWSVSALTTADAAGVWLAGMGSDSRPTPIASAIRSTISPYDSTSGPTMSSERPSASMYSRFFSRSTTWGRPSCTLLIACTLRPACSIAAAVPPATGPISWRAIFYLNIPFGLASAWMLQRYLREETPRHEHKLDILGTVSLTAAVTLLLLALIEGPEAWGWSEPRTIGFLVGGAFTGLGGLSASRFAIFDFVPPTVTVTLSLPVPAATIGQTWASCPTTKSTTTGRSAWRTSASKVPSVTSLTTVAL